MRSKCPNYGHKTKLNELLCIREDKKTINKEEKRVIIFRHNDFENIELYCAERFALVDKEGPESAFFHHGSSNNEENHLINNEKMDEGEKIPNSVFHATGSVDDVNYVESLGFLVDDDNAPAPEDIPTTNEGGSYDGYEAATWNRNGICPRKRDNVHNVAPSIKGMSKISILNGVSILTMFLTFLRKKFIVDVVLAETNNFKEKRLKLESSLDFLDFGSSWQQFLVSLVVNFGVKQKLTTMEAHLIDLIVGCHYVVLKLYWVHYPL